MNNTSMGYHTFSMFHKLNDLEFSIITSDFIKYADSNNDVKRFPIHKNGKKIGWKYTYKNFKGITWLLISGVTSNGFPICGVTVIINPKVIIENNYISAAQANDLKTIERVFNEEIKKISPLLYEMKYWSVNRVDYCLNIDLNELGLPCSSEQMMKLIKRGNIPYKFKEREDYDTISHRKVTDKNSFYLESKSSVINYYRKYAAINENHPDFVNRERFRNLIRLEVQCKYPKLYSISKKCLDKLNDFTFEELLELWEERRRAPSITIYTVLSEIISEDTTNKYFYKILRKGDYFTLETACDIVRSWNFRKEKEERMIYTLEIVSENRGIAKAKEKVSSIDIADFNASLRELDEILVNPVTIPRKWGIQYIPNLLQAYYDTLYEEELIPYSQYLAINHIKEFLKKK